MNSDSSTGSGGFKKEIGLFGGFSILGGIIIGSGIFYLGSIVLVRTGMSQGLALLCWIVGGIISMLGGLCYAELGASDPVAGGSVVYLSRAYHPVVGYMSGISSWLLGGPGSIAAVAVALPTALRTMFDLSDSAIKVVAVALVLALTVYNCFGVKLGTILQNISMIGKLIPIFIIMIGALIFGKETPSLSLVPAGGSADLGSIIGVVAFAVLATLWAYEGWTNLNTVAEEIKQPHKNLPLAIILSLGGITVLYTLFNFAIYRFLPMSEIAASIEAGDLYLGTKVAKGLMGDFGSVLVTAGMVISMFGGLNGMILAFPRTAYALGAEGHFFKSFGKLSPKYNVPTTALICQAAISIVLILARSLDQLTSLVVFASMLFNTLVILAVFVYRVKFPDMVRPYKVWGYPVTVVVTVLLFVGLMYNSFKEEPFTSLVGLAVPLAGAVMYFIFGIINKTKKER